MKKKMWDIKKGEVKIMFQKGSRFSSFTFPEKNLHKFLTKETLWELYEDAIHNLYKVEK